MKPPDNPRDITIPLTQNLFREAVMRKIQWILLSFYLSMPAAYPGTIRVPGDQPTIQAAIDSSAPGDTIRIDGGYFHERLVIRDKQLTIIGHESSSSFIHFAYEDYAPVPVIDIKNSEVALIDLQVVGGDRFDEEFGWYGSTRIGINSIESKLHLENIRMLRFFNAQVCIYKGSVYAKNVA